jgi:serine/threonine protein kinase
MATTTTGCGPSELIQRTISRDLHIDYEHGMIGRGRYGIVWRAKWNGDTVAVKCFFSMHENSWSRERQIYETNLLRHSNILGYIASDIMGVGCSVHMLLITEYHPHGSLYDYLQVNKMSKTMLVRFLLSIVNGLNHLHQEIFTSTKYKPAIAHRDLKSKNILVKENLECCLADFGLAVRFDSQLNQMDPKKGSGDDERLLIREGSVRYMAPECLNDRLDVGSISDLKKTDMYSFSLVIWELLSRLELRPNDDTVGEHRPPYWEYVEGEPCVQLMREIVCVKSIRPHLDRFKSLEKLEPVSLFYSKSMSTFKIILISYLNEKKEIDQLIEIMKECWNENPNERLSSLNIKKKIKRL